MTPEESLGASPSGSGYSAEPTPSGRGAAREYPLRGAAHKLIADYIKVFEAANQKPFPYELVFEKGWYTFQGYSYHEGRRVRAAKLIKLMEELKSRIPATGIEAPAGATTSGVAEGESPVPRKGQSPRQALSTKETERP